MGSKGWLILVALMAAEAVASLESGMVIAGMPRWAQMHGDPVKVAWLMSAFLIVQAAAAILGGRLGDMFGRRRVMIAALAICGLGSLVSGLSHELDWMIAGRAIQGVAGAIQPLCYGIIRENLPPGRMRFCISVIIATAAGAAAAGMVLGGYLTDTLGPQSIFLTMSLTATIALLMIFFIVPATAPGERPERIDYIGGLLFVPGVMLLLMAVSGLEGGGLSSAFALQAGGGAAILLVWALYELRQSEPMIDLRLLGNRNIALANIVIACSAISLMQAALAFSMLVQQPKWTGIGLGGTATMVGLLVAPSLIVATVGSLLTGWAADRFGPRMPILGGSILAAGALVGAIFSHDSFAVLLGILVLVGVGNIVIYSGVAMVVVAAAPADRVSEASGIMGVLRSIFRALGTQLLMLLLMTATVTAPGKAPAPAESAYMLVFSVMAVMSLIAGLIAFSIREGGPRPSRPARAPVTLPVSKPAT